MTRNELSARARAADDLVAVTLAEGADTAELDRLTALAATSLGCATAQVSLLSDHLVAAAVHGTGGEGRGRAAPFDETICAYALSGGGPVTVTDAAADPRVASIRAVTSGAVRAYLGVPLRLADDVMVGVLCVYGDQPREWTSADVEALSRIAGLIAIELQRPPGHP